MPIGGIKSLCLAEREQLKSMQIIEMFDDKWQSVLDRSLLEYGSDVINTHILNWLMDRKRLHDEIDAGSLKDKIDALTIAEREQIPLAIRMKLGLDRR